MIRNILLVGLGGGLGSIARYLCQKWFTDHYPSHFPWGTFTVNLIGSLLIGIFWGLSFRNAESAGAWKLFLMTGICGGFTTFSAFTLEAVGLLRQQRTGLFFVYIGANVLIGLLATFAGMKIVRL